MSQSSVTEVYGDFPRPEMQRYIPPGTECVLDVGCNLGGFGKSLKDKGVRCVWGVEANPEAAATASGRLDKVVVGYFAADQVPDRHFDVIVFNDVLEHMPDPWDALRIASTKLKPGGFVLASLPNLRHIDNLEHLLMEKDFRYEINGIRDKTHLRFYTRKSIPRLFEQSGYTIQQLDGINESWWSPSLLRRMAFRLFPGYMADTRFIQYAVVAAPVAV